MEQVQHILPIFIGSAKKHVIERTLYMVLKYVQV